MDKSDDVFIYVNSISFLDRIFNWKDVLLRLKRYFSYFIEELQNEKKAYSHLKSRLSDLQEELCNEKVSHEQIYNEQQNMLSEALTKISMLEEQVKLMKAKLKNIREMVNKD